MYKNIKICVYFYFFLSGVILQTHGCPDEVGKSLTEDSICNAMSKVFNNAKDWERERQKRAALKNRPSKNVTDRHVEEYQDPEVHQDLEEHQHPEELQIRKEQMEDEDESEESV